MAKYELIDRETREVIAYFEEMTYRDAEDLARDVCYHLGYEDFDRELILDEAE